MVNPRKNYGLVWRAARKKLTTFYFLKKSREVLFGCLAFRLFHWLSFFISFMQYVYFEEVRISCVIFIFQFQENIGMQYFFYKIFVVSKKKKGLRVFFSNIFSDDTMAA